MRASKRPGSEGASTSSQACAERALMGAIIARAGSGALLTVRAPRAPEPLLEPAVRVGLVVVGRDLDVAGGAVHRDGLGQRPVGLEPHPAPAARSCARLQL